MVMVSHLWSFQAKSPFTFLTLWHICMFFLLLTRHAYFSNFLNIFLRNNKNSFSILCKYNIYMHKPYTLAITHQVFHEILSHSLILYMYVWRMHSHPFLIYTSSRQTVSTKKVGISFLCEKEKIGKNVNKTGSTMFIFDV